MLADLLCRFLAHRPHRSRAWHDGLNYRAACRRCGTALIRDQQGWRMFERARDESPARHPHPVARPAPTTDRAWNRGERL